MRKAAANFFVAFGLLVILAGAFLIWIAYQPPPGPPPVRITFLGYTQDFSGRRQARFAITNGSSSTVGRQLRGQDLPDELVWPLSGYSELGAHASEIFTVRAPTNGYPWRVDVQVYPEAKAVRAIRAGVANALRRVGLKAKYRVVVYSSRTGWIEN